MKKKKLSFIGLILIVLLMLLEISNIDITNISTYLTANENNDIELTEVDNKIEVTEILNSELKVYFIDVGQADSILIQNENENMLIDAGNNSDGEKLVNYLKKLGIKDFKYVVGTHPHEDHIGGLNNIIDSFDIDTIYMPDVITTTKTFEEILDSLEAKNMSFTVPEIGSNFSLGKANFEVIYTGTDSSDLNNSSIVLKMTYGSNSFLFTGDATSEVEEKIISKNIKSEVLKIGHHGSKYSSSNEFLDKVNPKYAIISVGKNNSYGHPNIETLNNLKTRNIEIYRTDELGTILITSDGNKLNIQYLKTDTNG